MGPGAIPPRGHCLESVPCCHHVRRRRQRRFMAIGARASCWRRRDAILSMLLCQRVTVEPRKAVPPAPLYHARMRQSPAQSPPSAPPAPAGIVIEAARLRDLPALAALQRRAFPPRLAYTFATLALLWALPWVRVLIARRGKTIAGCIIGDRVIDGGRVINLAVDPEARRQGIGTALLAAIERALPVDTMTLMVQIENDAAQALYRGVGYVEEVTLPNYYGSGRAGVRMRKRLRRG